MARPRIDAEAVRADLLAAAEGMIRETRGRRLVLSEIAARVGLSQSYAHRFFQTKADVVRALAERWFSEIETAAERIAFGDAPAPERLEGWILTLLRLKRDRHDADPELFRAYLALAAEHPDLVGRHADKLSAGLKSILAEMVPPDALADRLALVEDATLLFRVPANIAQFRDRATDERALQVVRALLPFLLS